MNKKVLSNDVVNSILKNKKFKLLLQKKNKIQKLLTKKRIDLKVDQLFEYLENSIRSREYAKFIFTKSVNSILEKIINFSQKKKILIREIENLTINQLLNLSNSTKATIKKKNRK